MYEFDLPKSCRVFVWHHENTLLVLSNRTTACFLACAKSSEFKGSNPENFESHTYRAVILLSAYLQA